MKRAIWVALPLLLSGCGLPPVLTAFSTALDGLSLVSTGKSVGDNALSLVTDKDCAVLRLVENETLCRSFEDGETHRLVAAAEAWARGPEIVGLQGPEDEGPQDVTPAVAPVVLAAADPVVVPGFMGDLADELDGVATVSEALAVAPTAFVVPIGHVGLAADAAVEPGGEPGGETGGETGVGSRSGDKTEARSAPPGGERRWTPPPRTGPPRVGPAKAARAPREPVVTAPAKPVMASPMKPMVRPPAKRRTRLATLPLEDGAAMSSAKPLAKAPRGALGDKADRFANRPPDQVLVLGSFLRRANAERALNRLSAFEPVIVPVRLKGKTYYRVVAAPKGAASLASHRRRVLAQGVSDVWTARVCPGGVSSRGCVVLGAGN